VAEVLKIGAGYLVKWPIEPIPVSARVDRLREEKGDIKAEVEWKAHRDGHEQSLNWASLNLSSSAARLKRARELSVWDDTLWAGIEPLPWGNLVDQLANIIRDRERTGEPLRMLTGDPDAYPLAIPYLVRPLIMEQHATVFYGEGGLCKSWLALWIAMLLENGLSTCGLKAVQGTVLYLDWERSDKEINRRIAMFKAGGRFSQDLIVPYRRCYMSLGDELEEVMEMVAGLSAKVVVIDSLLGASGGENLNETKTAGKFFQAFRRLNTAGLIIAHTQKGNLVEKTVLGAGSWENQASSVWEVRAPKEAGASEVPAALLHRKVNIGRQHLPLAFRLSFGGAAGPQEEDTWAEIGPGDLNEVEGAERGIPAWLKIKAVLQKGALPIKEITTETDLPEDTVRKALKRKPRLFLKIPGSEADLWGLVDMSSGQ
jgi:hypothetical protein